MSELPNTPWRVYEFDNRAVVDSAGNVVADVRDFDNRLLLSKAISCLPEMLELVRSLASCHGTWQETWLDELAKKAHMIDKCLE